MKKVGRQDPNAYRNLESRVKVHSYTRMKDIKARFYNANDFESISPTKEAQAQVEDRMSACSLNVWMSILGGIGPIPEDACASTLDQIQGIGGVDCKLLFADRLRAFYCCLDAIDHIMVAGSAFIKRYKNRCKVAIPPHRFAILRCLHWLRPKAKRIDQTLLLTLAKRRKWMLRRDFARMAMSWYKQVTHSLTKLTR